MTTQPHCPNCAGPVCLDSAPSRFFTVCFRCCSLLRWEGGMELRRVTVTDLEDLDRAELEQLLTIKLLVEEHTRPQSMIQ